VPLETRGNCSTTNAFEPLAIFGHLCFAPEAGQRLGEDFLQIAIQLFQAVMRPFAVAPGFDEAGFAQISEVPGNFGLVRFEDFLQIADANFPALHKAQEAQTGFIREGRMEQGKVTHPGHIRVDRYEGKLHDAYGLAYAFKI
jgi:hypothetical protein